MHFRALARGGALVALALTAAVPAAQAATATDSSSVRNAVTVAGAKEHLAALQGIADANGGTRAAGTSGYDDSVQYVSERLEAAGYTVNEQSFDFPYFKEVTPAQFDRVSPDPRVYTADDFAIMTYSGGGNVTAPLQATNDIVIPPGATASTSNSGCQAADFTGFTSGNVALVQRGTCTFFQKAQNAQTAGASAVVIFNEGQPGRQEVLNGTLGGVGVTIPVIGTSFAVGEELYGQLQSGAVTVHVFTDTITETRTASNIWADTGGRADRTVVVGGHLDSVEEGPGINDNGSGSAAILELAEAFADEGVAPRNRVRFAFWGAEELGLLGSEYYVANLTSKQRNQISLNLNFDMVASPNYASFIYDGDGSDTPQAGPNGSAVIEDVFTDYFDSQSLPHLPTAFDGRSDYGPFIEAGIPAGGLFTGAEGVKTAEQAVLFGGTAGLAYDPCYHQACDTLANVNDEALDLMSDAIAHSTVQFAMTTSSVNGTSKGSVKSLDWKGGHQVR